MAPEQLSGLSRRKNKMRWLLFILIILIILALIYLLYLYLNSSQVEPDANLNDAINQTVAPAPPSIIIPQVIVDSESLSDAQVLNGEEGIPSEFQPQANSAQLIATSFTERFGSYSNQSNYRNLDELDVFMTDSMKAWIVKYKEELIENNPDINVYYAIETKAISTINNVFNEKEGLAEILVKTQRQEFEDVITNPRVFYQDLLLKLSKSNGDWKVSGAYWQ